METDWTLAHRSAYRLVFAAPGRTPATRWCHCAGDGLATQLHLELGAGVGIPEPGDGVEAAREEGCAVREQGDSQRPVGGAAGDGADLLSCACAGMAATVMTVMAFSRAHARAWLPLL
mmetsp:Transcript_109996/g.350297  ORF Transcript_109996/g.350297 Transcript_109996/m.350297 type:complete len:118 (+) Transcript_109996:2762-3115(+)